MTVSEIMTVDVTSLSPDSSIESAVAAFAERDFRHLLVLDAAGHVAGVLSDRDVLRFMAHGLDPAKRTVRTIMSREAIVARPDMAVVDVIDVVVFHRINCLPVVDESGAVRGIVTTTDLLRAFHELLDERRPGPATARTKP